MIQAMDAMLNLLIDELRDRHACHTVILYGSRARGDHSAHSDYDVLGIRKDGEAYRDARPWQDSYLDAFIYPEAAFDVLDEGMLRLHGGRVLIEQEAWGRQLLMRVDALFSAGPAAPDPTEVQTRITWARKMLARIQRQDLEAHYRRHWLLVQLLEDYFYLRRQWYRGPKESFAWLQANDPPTYSRFEAALEPHASDEHLHLLVEHVIAPIAP
ncbi:nucleotidyltransferase domain-containing protein [bacterium]|nr:nucleotidyltransferase domain-containing protein [bacterium]